MMKLTCQIIVAALLLIGFFSLIKKDVNGEEEKEPRGFRGVCITIITFSLVALCYWKAGAFSELLISPQ